MSPTKYTSKLHEARVLIFGGTSGIGFCVAEAAIEHAAHVCICGSKQVKLENAISRLQSNYPDSASKIVGHICDLSQPDVLEHNLDTVLRFATSDSKIDHIVFTSGDALQIIPIAEATIESILKLGNVRFMAPLMLAKLAPRYMSAGPKSSITLTGGSMSHKPAKGWTLIAAWGSGVEGITRGLAVDLAPVCYEGSVRHGQNLGERWRKATEVIGHGKDRRIRVRPTARGLWFPGFQVPVFSVQDKALECIVYVVPGWEPAIATAYGRLNPPIPRTQFILAHETEHWLKSVVRTK